MHAGDFYLLTDGRPYYVASAPDTPLVDGAAAFATGPGAMVAWRLAFIGMPALNVTLGQVYRLNRGGAFNWPLAGKLCEIAMGILLLASFLV